MGGGRGRAEAELGSSGMISSGYGLLRAAALGDQHRDGPILQAQRSELP